MIRNYWSLSETCESLKNYIGMNFKGLKKDVIRMLGGEAVKVNISTFQNDIISFKSKDDVLTLLVHLGYLSYNAKSVMILNQEVADLFFLPKRDTDKPAMIIDFPYQNRRRTQYAEIIVGRIRRTGACRPRIRDG